MGVNKKTRSRIRTRELSFAPIRPRPRGFDLREIDGQQQFCLESVPLLLTTGYRLPGHRLAFAFEIECHGCADKVLQSRLINLLAFVDIDGAPDISVKAGIE
jgi:hypothetical protein